MKLLMLFLAVFLTGHYANAQAECIRTIATTDKIKDVTSKLTCLSEENKRLMQENKAYKDKLLIPNRIFIAGSAVKPGSLKSDTCKNRATDEIVRRGGNVIETTEISIDFILNENSIGIACPNANTNVFLVAVSGKDQAKNSFIAIEILKKIVDR